jgi:hypothetical protein
MRIIFVRVVRGCLSCAGLALWSSPLGFAPHFKKSLVLSRMLQSTVFRLVVQNLARNRMWARFSEIEWLAHLKDKFEGQELGTRHRGRATHISGHCSVHGIVEQYSVFSQMFWPEKLPCCDRCHLFVGTLYSLAENPSNLLLGIY